ncbi:MAG TPA: hypothetical protein VLA19_14540 [Herpetosiphonaceae bacterium]|nr:hypothetical protein [Herpetosiphonaceae bacterium]
MMIERADTYEDHAHPKRYSSFLLRCWCVGQGELRIKLEHIQSGDSTQVNSYDAALTWLSERCSMLRDREEGDSQDGTRSMSEHGPIQETDQM